MKKIVTISALAFALALSTAAFAASGDSGAGGAGGAGGASGGAAGAAGGAGAGAGAGTSGSGTGSAEGNGASDLNKKNTTSGGPSTMPVTTPKGTMNVPSTAK